ncbi:histidine kinase CKI1 [Amaranthus tricolor]|uniref:histidine kinase CKI1 n=1 Tax=Amaranthus tricolor TaxID=29722 RepID=UPI00258F0BE9|nr:histidine kinase CKI1 [Amaranthus tricolor]
MGEIVSIIAMKPFTFFFLLTFAILLLPSILIPYWYHMMKKIEGNVEMATSFGRHELMTNIEDAAKLNIPINSSSINLARVLENQFVADNNILFSDIKAKVMPALYEAQLIIPHVMQVSYIGLDGLFFSYTKQDDQIFAIYSNTTFKNNLDHYIWYTQLVNSTTGHLHGETMITKPSILVNETWFKQAINSPNGYVSIGFQWNTTSTKKHVSNLLLDTMRLGQIGALSLGFSLEGITDVFTSTKLLGSASLYIASMDCGYVLMDGIKDANIRFENGYALIQGRNQNYVGHVPCKHNGVRNVGGITLEIAGIDFIFYCSTIDIATVPLGYVLAFPSKGLVHVHNHTKVALILLVIMMVAMVISVLAFVALIVRAARREVHLCAAYMREMERTSQAERKNMKQSLAFARANHDVRGYLACIKGLIQLSYTDLPPSSEVVSNMKKIETCAEDLLVLVNSILDFSKMEAGKMQLEETEFDLGQLLEDIADLQHPVATKKGVDVILDPCDGSIFKFSLVKGDRSKLKQILGNLLSNAVKFTSQGHISIRCHARKLSLENSIIASNRNSLLNRLSSFFHKNKRAYNDLEEMKTIKQDPNCMEFEFEVEDTGPGIPKDKRLLIFENFVQVKETSAGQVGTGLGLGIVQSLVRLMGGDIEIVDKANGEKGTCFRFNIFLIVQEETVAHDHPTEQLLTEHKDTNLSAGLTTCVQSPRTEKSLVILLIKNEARRGMVQRYMESLGINVFVLSQTKQFSSTLKKIKSKIIEPQCYNSSSGRSDFSPPCGTTYLSSSSDCCKPGPKLLPLSRMEGRDDVLPVYRRSKIRGPMKCILLVIDCNAGDDFQKLQRVVSQFRKDLHMTCTKVVWLDRPDTRREHFQGLQDENLPPTDHIMSEPLHGSRLSRIIRLLPEFGGTTYVVSKAHPQSETEEEFVESSGGETKVIRNRKNTKIEPPADSFGRDQLEVHRFTRSSRSSSSDKPKSQTTKIAQEREETNQTLPLEGKKILIVEDHLLQRKLAQTCVTRLGADNQLCGNGKEALDIVCKALSELLNEGTEFPYDLILMDCQMPVMDGFEATKRIREEEKKYGVHIPIIALTAHEMDGEEGKKIAEAGMDFQLTKPLQRNELLNLVNLVLG